MTGILEIPAADYYSDAVTDQPSLNATIARVLCTESPAHARAKHPRLNPDYVRQDEERFDIGTISHALLLEGQAAVSEIAADDWRTKDAKAMRDDARANGQIPLLAKRWADVQAMVAAVREQLEMHAADPPLFVNGKPEQTLVWDEDGIACRARLDWLHDDVSAIDDFKSTSRSANPEQWSRILVSSGYDVQASFYLRGLRAVTGTDAEFRFCVAETTPPYALSVISPGPAVLALANDKCEYALATWRRCLERDEWPAYTSQVCYADLPGWEETRWLDKEAREAA